MIARTLGAIARTWRWCVDPVCSHDGKPSHPKLVTWAMLLMIACGRAIPVVTVIALTASSYGLKAFLMFLQHNTSTSTSADTTARTIVDETRRVLSYTETGEPAESLPAQPDAKTPAGGD